VDDARTLDRASGSTRKQRLQYKEKTSPLLIFTLFFSCINIATGFYPALGPRATDSNAMILSFKLVHLEQLDAGDNFSFVGAASIVTKHSRRLQRRKGKKHQVFSKTCSTSPGSPRIRNGYQTLHKQS
jgi:hypothetical protein